MNTVVNNYRYVITYRLGVLQVQPLGESDFKLEWERTEDVEFDYLKTLPSKITFIGTPYQSLLKLERSIYRCELIQISVQRRCVAAGVENWVSWFDGEFTLNEGLWNIDRCEVELSLNENSVSKCIEENKSVTFDLMKKVFTRVVVNTTPPNVVIQKTFASQTGSSTGGGLIPRSAWDPGSPFGPDPYAVGFVIYQNNFNNNGTTWSAFTSWARLVMTLDCLEPSPSPESGWIPIEDTCGMIGGNKKFAKGVSVYDCQYSYPAPEGGSDMPSGEIMNCKILGDTDQVSELKNGMFLSDCLQAFITEFCPGKTVVSNFFQINPDAPSSINYVTGLRSKTTGIVVYQKSDVKRPTATGATKAEVTFDKFIKALTLMFNCKWRIVGNVFRIEHVSYFPKPAGFDLTLPKYAPYVAGMYKYSYQTEEIPEREIFKFMESNFGSDFEGRPIIYSGGCVSKSSQDNAITYSTEIVTTDVQLCISNPAIDSKVVDDNGLVFVATETNGTVRWILSEDGILTETALNNTVAWAQLHRDYHKYNRPLKTGNMNDLQTTFITVKPTKKGENIKIPLCCSDVFNPDSYIITQLGTGTVSKATFSFKDETLELELVYSAYDGLVGNTPPVANNDVKNLYLNQEVFINVLANDYDPDIDDSILSVEIVTPPIHGTANVMPDKTIRYKPTLGYLGDDYINYRIRDEWNEPSNTALIAINVFPANTPPVANDDFYETPKGTSLSVLPPGVFANDHDDIGFTLDSYDSVSAVGGIVNMNPDGSFSYAPLSPTYAGVDFFDYTIIDDQGLTATARVYITVRDPDFPIAVDDAYQTAKDSGLSVLAPGVLGNDINPLPGALTTPGMGVVSDQGGTAIINIDGSFNYSPPTGFAGVDFFDYTVLNSAGSDQGRVTITVVPPLFIRFSKVNDLTHQVTSVCGGVATNTGSYKSATFRLNFYQDLAGTMPFDVTGSGLIVNIEKKSRNAPVGPYITEVDNFADSTGTQFDYLLNETYFLDTENCDGTPQFYLEAIYTLLPGSYTII